MFSTMSNSPLYCPRDPTEIPWEPLHHIFCTSILVLLGLKDTQSEDVISRNIRPASMVFTVSVVYHGILDHNI